MGRKQSTLTRTHALLSHAGEDALSQLRQAVVFRDLCEEDLHALAMVAERRSCCYGELIDGPRNGEDGIFVVACGSVRVYLLSPEGRELTLFDRGPGGVFELRDLEAELPGDALAQASADGTLLYTILWSHFLEIVAFRPGAASSLACLLREGVMHERRLIRELAFYNMRSRLAHKLAEIARGDAEQIVSKSREELAAMIGTRPEEISRALRHFLEEGLVFYRPHGRSIAVLDLDHLDSY